MKPTDALAGFSLVVVGTMIGVWIFYRPPMPVTAAEASEGHSMHAPLLAPGMRAAPAPAPAVELELQHSETLPYSDAASTAPHEDATQATELELLRLRARIRELGAELASLPTLQFRLRQAELYAALEPDGQIGAWAATLPAAAVPDERTRLTMASLLHDYPAELQPEEGTWLVERIQAGDWYLWGPSADEAIIAFLGAGRIAQACTPTQLAHLQEEWAEQGYFAP
jgi:hypothetical protein